MSNDVSQARPLETFHLERPVFFPSEASLRWFVRMNKKELVDAGALTIPSGRWLVQPEAFDQVLQTIGTRRARKIAAIE